MSTVYLVDYENVHEHGIYGMRMLPVDDTVFILYTENADKVSLDCFDNVQAYYRVIKVPAGKQSLDMHLSSFLGYLIGSEEDPETKYVVISNDTDFHGVINFWMARYSTPDKVTRQRYIGDTGVCIDPIIQPEVPEYCKPVPRANRRDIIRQNIKYIFKNDGERDEWGCLRIQLSLLCARLNNLPAYQQERKICGKKPQQFLAEDFPDQVRIDYVNRTTYAYAVQPINDCQQLQEYTDKKDVDTAGTETVRTSEVASDTHEEMPNDNSIETELGSVTEVDTQKRGSDELIHDIEADDELFSLPDIPDIECVVEEDAVEEAHEALSETYSDSEKRLIEGGIDSVVAAVIAPIVANLELVDSPKVYLYNNIRQHFGNKQGTHYYHQVKELLQM